MLEFSANDQTIDAISNKKPAISNLRVIIKEQEIVEAKQFYASPLTTLKTFLALRYSNGNINSAYEDAQNTVNAIFSPFNNTNEQVPLLINGYDESQQIYTYYYRQASEGLAALLVELKNVTGLEMDVLFREVSDDLSDGKLDAISASEPLSYKPENLDVIHNPIQELFIPGTTEKLSQLLSKLSDEAEALTGEPINILINSAISESPLYIAGNIDFDNDGSLNHIDMDDDNDGYDDSEDKFPFNNTEYLDTDGDRIGNNADTDDDNDGVPDLEDAFPLDANEHVDTDNDGIGNNADNDDDNDGFPDASDAFPLDPTEHLDTDLDGIGNNKDDDDDNDGVNDDDDAFPLDPNEYLDTDLDGIGNNADTDDDNDGVPDTE
ncbi:thrombospondin type 3 repeat-containing protein, partial [Pseudoalteromonas sp. G4]|uniref:thrombospondin type 3 repeat-containing protein n=1 Tax=Pseudoalteromonas sp. G4 TaxID=2992761 RepID=UPI00315980C6